MRDFSTELKSTADAFSAPAGVGCEGEDAEGLLDGVAKPEEAGVVGRMAGQLTLNNVCRRARMK